VHLYSNLPQYAGNNILAEAEGTTIGECLDNLIKQFPGLGPEIYDRDGNLHSGLFISINLKSAAGEKITRPLEKTDELYLIKIVAGG
jgi:hypothetical protein